MNSCCLSPKKTAPCPVNGKLYKQVKRKTILHQVTRPWTRELPEQAYYYCDDPQCEVVYFAEDNLQITSSEMRLDERARNTTICFCFDVTNNDLENNKQQCEAFIKTQTRLSACNCEIKNPSGKCCLKDFQ